jgi:hypothetical protein
MATKSTLRVKRKILTGISNSKDGWGMTRFIFILFTASACFSSAALAQNKRGSEYYEARIKEFEGKEVRVEVESASLAEVDSEDPSLSWFYVHTVDGLAYALVPQEKLRSFERRYKNENYSDPNRLLRGILRQTKSGKIYIDVRD